MKITELAVRRPVTTTMFFTGMIIMGIISITRTPRELLPSMNYPQITVITKYEAATPEEIERQVTTVLEEAVGTAGRLRGLSSRSREGLSMIIAEFEWGTDMNVASMDVREKIDLVKERLPRETDEPMVIQYNPFELPVITLILTDETGATDTETLYRMKESAENIIKNNLEKIENVASVEIKGGREREIQVEVSPERLRASNLSLLKIVQVIQDSNLVYPAGTIESDFYEYLIKTDGEYKSLSDIRNTPVSIARHEDEEARRRRTGSIEREAAKGVISLSDIAIVNDSFKEEEGIIRHNGREAIAIDIQRQSGANVVEVSQNIRNEIDRLKDQLPSEYILEVVYDQSEYVEKSIQGIASSALVGSIFAFLVLFMFLRSFTNSLVVAVAIPVSLAVTFIFVYFGDISLNMMSLGGLALGVGMLVDSSIVVLENIFRYNQQNPGMDIKNAVSGTGEVTGAITSSTLTTITVFFPFVFITGVAGQLFKELAFTVTFSLIAALMVAITLIPRMAAAVKNKEIREPAWSDRLKEMYSSLMESFFKKPALYLGIAFAAFILSAVYLIRADQEFIPRSGSNQFIMDIELPYGTVLSRTNEIVRRIEAILDDMDVVEGVTSNIGATEGTTGAGGTFSLMGSHQAELSVTLKTASVRHMDNAISLLRERIRREGIRAGIEYNTEASVIGGVLAGGAPIEVDVKGDNIDGNIRIASELVNRLEEVPYIYGARSTFRGFHPELNVEVNKDRAALHNISAQNITMTAQTAIRGYVATQFRDKDEEVDVRVRLAGGSSRDEDDIGRIAVHSPLGYDVPLQQIAGFSRGGVAPEILRKGGSRTVAVTANYAGVSFGRAISAVEDIVNHLQSGYRDHVLEISGDQEQIQESFRSLIFVILLSIVFVYMIMASQFESLWQPFIIIFTLPLSFIGVALILFLTGTQLSVIVLLGIIMLGGIVVNNGIVLISRYNFVEETQPMNLDTLIQASTTRLRPVLMTAVTTVLGLIPMAVAGGEGSEFRSPLAIAVIGGLLISTFLTLFVVPAVYFYGKNYISRVKDFISHMPW